MNKRFENIKKKNPLLDDNWIDDFAPYLMNRIMGRYNESLRLKMTSLDLTTPKMRTLAVLSATQGMLINELAVYAVVEQSTLSRALEQLDTDGLVKREIDIIDTRATRVYLTPLGLEAFKSLWPDMLTSYNEMFNEFEGNMDPDLTMGDGDVKYHLGYSSLRKYSNNKKIYVKLVPNPSHLESVSPVVQGYVRAQIDDEYQKSKGII